jgi:hypothetical protein
MATPNEVFNVPASGDVQAQEPVQMTVTFKGWEWENVDDERWIAKVFCGGTDFRVYVDTMNIEVSPNGCAARTLFNWNDYLLENVKGDVARACMICVLAVALQVQ